MIVKDWKAKALRAAAAHMEAQAVAAEAEAKAEESKNALKALGLDIDGYDFRRLLDSGTCQGCDAPQCDARRVIDTWEAKEHGGRWLCEKHDAERIAAGAVEYDARAEKGEVLP